MMTILLADPNSAMRKAQASMLAEIGLTDIVEAASGSEVAAALSRGPLRLAVVSERLDSASTIDVIALVRKKSQSTAILFCTNDHNLHTSAAALKAGACAVVLKPFPAGLFKEKAAQAMGIEAT